MAAQVAHHQKDVDAVLLDLHKLVTYGPGDLDIAAAMSAYGYDAVKWAEGQGVLAELVTCDLPSETCLALAVRWCQEATMAARSALATRPRLLDKLGVMEA
jgi:hypothetical protein